MKNKPFFLLCVLIIFAAILRPHKRVLQLIRLFYRSLAVSISGFLSYKIAPLFPGAFSEAIHGLVPAPLMLAMTGYLMLMFAGSLMFWKVADNCTIQLSNRFNLVP